MNKTTAGFVCLLKGGSVALKRGMMRSMVLTGKKKPSSKMEGLGTRVARSTTEKDRKRTDNLSTAKGRKTEKDRQRGKKTAVEGKGTERMLDTGSRTDMKFLENDDQPVLS